MRGKENMERLTVDYGEKFRPFRYAMANGSDAEVGYFKNYDAFFSHMLLVQKLGEYEDLEEQGRLLKLPCDKAYYIVDKNNPKFAAVMSKSIRDLAIYEVEKIDIDGRYFSTKELAEAKLKEKYIVVK